jgi:hypothetical protein
MSATINNLLAAYEKMQRDEDARFAAAPKDQHAEIMKISGPIQDHAHDQYFVGAIRLLLTLNIAPDETNLRDYDITREGNELLNEDGEHLAYYGDADGYDNWKLPEC